VSPWTLELPWSVEPGTEPETQPSVDLDANPVEERESSLRLIWEGDGWLGGAWRQVRSSERSDGCEFDVPGWGRAVLTPANREVRIFPEGAVLETAPGLSMEVVLGPILALMLAYEGTFCLHAGSVLVDGRVVALLGESGIGKSTLSVSAGPEWAQLGDDILAVDSSGCSVRPRFPQLKLQQQYPVAGPESVALGRILALAPYQPGEENSERKQEIFGEP